MLCTLLLNKKLTLKNRLYSSNSCILSSSFNGSEEDSKLFTSWSDKKALIIMREYGGLSLKPASSKHIIIRCLLYHYNKHTDVVLTMSIEGGSGLAGVCFA